MTKRSILETLGKLILILFGISMAILGAELVARWLGPPFKLIENGEGGEVGRIMECDREIGWRGIPHGEAPQYFDEVHQLVWNSLGMHDGEHQFEKEAGVFRILMLGDSFVQAIEVSEKETSHHVLEDILNERAPDGVRFEVIAGGILSWGPNQELMFFRTTGKQFKPDLVIGLWFPSNDLRDILPRHAATLGPDGGVNCYAPYFAICDGTFDPQPWYVAPGIEPTWRNCSTAKKWTTNLLNQIYHHSRLYQRLDTSGYEQPAHSLLFGPWIDHDRQNEQLNYAYELTGEVYAQLATEAKQLGAETRLVTVPDRSALDYETNPNIQAQIVADNPILIDADPQLPNKRFVELMESKGVPVLDLYPEFLRHFRSNGENLHYGGHWNKAGNRKVAQHIADWLIEQELVP